MESLVSIITPTYNCGRYIGATIESVIKQTYTNWEMIIVDDCSTDETKQVVKKYADYDERIKYHILNINSGAAIARNKAMELAKGEYMAFLDSDDLWIKDKLEKQLLFMEVNGYNLTCTKYRHIDENGVFNGKVIGVKKRVDYNGVLLSCPIGNSSVMYNVKNLGKFRIPDIRKRNDDALWLQILKKEKYAYGLDEILMEYRIRANSISRNKFDLVRYHWYLYRKIEKLSLARSMFHICFWGFVKLCRLK